MLPVDLNATSPKFNAVGTVHSTFCTMISAV